MALAHKQKKSKKQKMGFVCPRCRNEFTQKHHLRAHIEKVHEKKRHKCDQCEKDFADRSGLRYHKLTKHEGKKRKRNKKQCPHCNKSFTTDNYNQHLLTHESLKPFLCPFCSNCAAKRLDALKRHIDSVHFKCRWFCLMDGCNASMSNISLKAHLKKKHNISSNFINHMEQRRTTSTPSSLTPVRGKLPSAVTTNDPREASTSIRQQSAQQSFTVKFEDIDTQTKLRSLLNQLELIATSTSSDSSSSDDDSSDKSSDQSDVSEDKSDEPQETKESESEDSAMYLVEEEMNKRRRLTWHNPDVTGSSSDDDDDDDDVYDDDDNNKEKQSDSKSSASSSSSFSFTSKPKEKEEPKEEEDASSSSSGPPPRRIDVKPRKMVAWIPTGERSQRGIDVNQLQQRTTGCTRIVQQLVS